MIDDEGSRIFNVPSLSVEDNVIYAGKCVFTRTNCVIDLPGIKGEILYGPLTELKSDIMGPFRFLPMECRHQVISMRHRLRGSLITGGKEMILVGGLGYIEKDSGISFPKKYLWLQCNDFPEDSSVMISIADIPFLGMHFTGCICAIIHEKREYRLATYHGVRILAARPDHICLLQKDLLLKIDIERTDNGHPLMSPVSGKMSGIIRESNQARSHIRLWRDGIPVLDLKSQNSGFEYME